MHIEGLESRHLMASDGIDSSFGDAGRANLSYATQFTAVGDARLAVTGAVFYELPDGRFNYLVKFDEDGRLDRAWGLNGKVKLAGDAEQLAYDKRTGALFVGGTTPASGAGQSLFVLRLTKAGVADAAFGPRGVATYAVEANVDGGKARVSVDRLVALPEREVLVAMNRQSIGPAADDIFLTTRTTQDVALMKLRSNGRRDVDFGRRGVTTVLSGRRTTRLSDFVSNITVDESTLADLRPRDDGGFHVVIARASGTLVASSSGQDEGGLSGSIAIKSRAVSAGGDLDEDAAYSWTIPAAEDAAGRRIRPLIVGADGERGGDGVTAVYTYADPLRPNTADDGATLRYDLVPGRRPVAIRFDPTGVAEVTEVVRGNRSFFVADAFGRVAKFSSEFDRDVSFGSRGTGNLGVRGSGYFADADDRVLVINQYFELARFRSA